MSNFYSKDPEERPPHPGGLLREDFLLDYGISPTVLARFLNVSRQTINELLRERRALSPHMAVRLARLFRNDAEYWLDAQGDVDIWEARREIAEQLERIRPLHEVQFPMINDPWQFVDKRWRSSISRGTKG